MPKWCAACIILRLEKGKPESGEKLNVGGIEGISCQHFQVMMTTPSSDDDTLVTEALGVAGGQETNGKSRKCVKTQDVLGKHGHHDLIRSGETEAFCPTMEDHDMHGWIVAAFLREMAGLEGQATSEGAESIFSIARCIRQRSVEASRLWLKIAMQILVNVEPVGKETNGRHIRSWWTKNSPNMRAFVDRQRLGHVSFEGTWSRNLRVYGGQVLILPTRRRTLRLIPKRDITEYFSRKS